MKCHDGVKAAKCVWLSSSPGQYTDDKYFCTTGFSQQAGRELCLWDRRKLGNAAQTLGRLNLALLLLLFGAFNVLEKLQLKLNSIFNQQEHDYEHIEFLFIVLVAE